MDEASSQLVKQAYPLETREDMISKSAHACSAKEQLLEGDGERSLLCYPFPKLARLQSIQDKAKAELQRWIF